MTNTPLTTAGLAGLVAMITGCVKAPDIVLTDQKTALEQQAAGEFRALENDLHQAGISPKGEDFTRETLEAKNPDPGKSTLGEVVQLYSAVRSDSELLDELLVAGCVGEGLDGLLVHTPEQCSENVEAGPVTRAVERANLHRRQLWQVIGKRNSESSPGAIRAAWRKIHLQRVVCGALIQTAGAGAGAGGGDGGDKKWEKKAC